MRDDALGRARKLVADLERDRALLAGSPESLPSDNISEGIAAYDAALTAARRVLRALENAGNSIDGPKLHD